LNQSGLSLHLSRTLPARRSRVFAALTEPEELARWFGPNGFTARSVDVDLRVGGAYRIAMQPPEGELFYLGGEFREVDPPAHLSYTFCYEDPDPEDQETIVTLSLEDLVDATELEFSQREFATERRRALHEEGWANSLDRLREMLFSRASVD
jgi:uncharacterized protein YndB with AHSA1/START domain